MNGETSHAIRGFEFKATFHMQVAWELQRYLV